MMGFAALYPSYLATSLSRVSPGHGHAASLSPAPGAGVVPGRRRSALGAMPGGIGAVVAGDLHPLAGHVEVNSGDGPGLLDAEDLGVEVGVSHDPSVAQARENMNYTITNSVSVSHDPSVAQARPSRIPTAGWPTSLPPTFASNTVSDIDIKAKKVGLARIFALHRKPLIILDDVYIFLSDSRCLACNWIVRANMNFTAILAFALTISGYRSTIWFQRK